MLYYVSFFCDLTLFLYDVLHQTMLNCSMMYWIMLHCTLFYDVMPYLEAASASVMKRLVFVDPNSQPDPASGFMGRLPQLLHAD